MKALNPTTIVEGGLVESDVPELNVFAEWEATTSWNVGARVAVTTAGESGVYDCLVSGNVNHPPASSPTWWRYRYTVHAAYNAGVTYAAGYKVVSGHRIYESLQGGNLGHPVAATSWWLDLGPSNRWAMFDRAVGTMTASVGSISVALAPGAVGALAVVDTTAETVRVKVSVGGTQLYDRTKSANVSGGSIADWYAYFTDEVGRLGALTFLDLPLYSNGEITVTLTGSDPGGPVAVGTLLVGRVIDLGTTETGPTIGINDFSRKETDQFGVTDVVERPWAKRATIRSMIPTSSVDGVQRNLASLRARPALWIGEEGFDSLTIYGFFKDFSIDLAFASVSYCSLTIEGLI